MKKMNRKESLEYHAVINFIQEYNLTHKRQLIFSHLTTPPEPDAICELNGNKIGIEVVLFIRQSHRSCNPIRKPQSIRLSKKETP